MEVASLARGAGRSAGRERARVVPLLTAVSAVVLAAAWVVRRERYLTAESGLGYALGAVGLGLMVLLLVYPMRKRLAFASGWGPLRRWFDLHMALGVLGPLAILLHANFRLGSRNSSVALVSMLLVAGSGYVGRFFYTRVHRGLFGRRRYLDDLRQEAEASYTGLRTVFDRTPGLAEHIERFEARMRPGGGPLRGMVRFLGAPLFARSAARACRTLLRRSASAGRLDRRTLEYGEVAVLAHLQAWIGVAQFTAWERLFGLWHAFHLPLCFLLFGAAAAHVVAVHMF